MLETKFFKKDRLSSNSTKSNRWKRGKRSLNKKILNLQKPSNLKKKLNMQSTLIRLGKKHVVLAWKNSTKLICQCTKTACTYPCAKNAQKNSLKPGLIKEELKKSLSASSVEFNFINEISKSF